MSRNIIFNTEFQNFIIPGNFQKFSGTLDIAWKWPIFCQFQRIGYFSHSVFGLEHDFQCGIPKFHQSWNLPGIVWNSGIPLDMGYFLLKLTNWVLNQSNVMILHTIGSILWFLKPGILTSRNPGIPWIWLVFAGLLGRVRSHREC